MKVIDYKDAIDRRLYEGAIVVVETAIYRFLYLKTILTGEFLLRNFNFLRSFVFKLGE